MKLNFHVTRETLQELEKRLTAAVKSIQGLSYQPGSSRLKGKEEGVNLALSYVQEELRGLTQANSDDRSYFPLRKILGYRADGTTDGYELALECGHFKQVDRVFYDRAYDTCPECLQDLPLPGEAWKAQLVLDDRGHPIQLASIPPGGAHSQVLIQGPDGPQWGSLGFGYAAVDSPPGKGNTNLGPRVLSGLRPTCGWVPSGSRPRALEDPRLVPSEAVVEPKEEEDLTNSASRPDYTLGRYALRRLLKPVFAEFFHAVNQIISGQEDLPSGGTKGEAPEPSGESELSPTKPGTPGPSEPASENNQEESPATAVPDGFPAGKCDCGRARYMGRFGPQCPMCDVDNV